MTIEKATSFYEIQDAVVSNIPVDDMHKFYTDFSEFRNNFKEQKIYKLLNINPISKECNPLQSPKKIFLSGYRGTGKTSELLKLTHHINETKCYFSIFVNIGEEELDINNIETVDILILMVEKLVKRLDDEKKITIKSDTIESFYEWYATTIREINGDSQSTGKIEVGAKASIGLLSLLKLTANTKAQLQTTTGTKETIRRVFNHKFSDFSIKFNEFILSIKEQFIQDSDSYHDILFIVDGFEKIGTLEARKKILIDDSNKFVIIKAHMITTLPIELFTEKNSLNHFSNTIHFPLVDLGLPQAKSRMREFIDKRVARSLFANSQTVDTIIEHGAGHPRQTLQIIGRAFVEAEGETIDLQSVTQAIKALGDEMFVLSEDEIALIHQISNNKPINHINDTYIGLRAKNIIFDYGIDGKESVINPIIKAHPKFLISQPNA